MRGCVSDSSNRSRGCLPRKPIPRIHHQRGADDQHRIGVTHALHGGSDSFTRHALAIKHNIRFQQPTAGRAPRHLEACKIQPLEVSIAVRRHARIQVDPVGIQTQQCFLELRARRAPLAPHTTHEIESAVQIDDLGAPRRLVQTIDILGHQDSEPSLLFQGRQGPVRIVRSSTAEAPPTDQAARPVALARRWLVHEGPKLHRLRPFPGAVGITVIGNPRIGTTSGAGENEQPRVAAEKIT